MQTPSGSPSVQQSDLVYPRERVYYALVVVVSLAVYGVLGLVALKDGLRKHAMHLAGCLGV